MIFRGSPFKALSLLGTLFSFLTSFACGTIAGNPKKPSNPPAGQTENPPTDPEATATLEQMKLPLISFDLGDTTPDDTGVGVLLNDFSPMHLTANDEEIADIIDQRDSILNGWSKRVEKILENMNNVSRAVNTYLEKNEAELEAQSSRARIRKKEDERKFSAMIEKTPQGQETSYQATICFGDKIGAQLVWDQKQTKISFTRDLNAKIKDPDEDISLISHLSVEKKENGVIYRLETFGNASSFTSSSGDEPQTVEYAESILSPSGVIELKYVADSFVTVPADLQFEGDSYLVGRIHPTSLKGSHGKNRTKKEFVAYQKNLETTVCKNGFDEASPNLWNPKLSEPRFCLGRPLGSRKFKNINSYLDTLLSLKPIGLAGKSMLKIPTFSKNTPCDF